MELREHFETSGQWLFRWRSYLPAVMLVPLAVVVANYHWPLGRHDVQEVWEIACLMISATGLLLRFLVAGRVPAGTSGRNTKRQRAESLNTTGMYSLCRHPLYLANFLVGLGWTMFFLNGWLLTFYVMSFWLYYERIMMTEEAFLREQFGDAFRSWADRTRAFLPRLASYQPPVLPFSWRTAIRREYLTSTGAVTGFVILELAEHWRMEHRLIIEPFWVVLAVGSGVVFLVVRCLRKFTPCLAEKGR